MTKTLPCKKFLSTAAGTMLAVLLAGCVGNKLPPPPPATETQVEKERTHLQATFFSDSCMEKLRKAASELKPGDEQQGGGTLYAVEYAPNTAVRDGVAYQLHVKEQERLGYLYTGDGSAGSYRVSGPLPLWQCMQGHLL
jgi:hypothetical protein